MTIRSGTISREKTRSRPFVANGFYMATVSRVDGANVYVTVPRLTSTFEYGPIFYVGSFPTVGDRLLVGFMEGRADEIVGFTNPATAFAFSLSGSASVKEGSHRLYFPFPCDVKRVQVSAGTAPVGDSVIVDLNKDGTTIFTTQANRPTIAAGGYVSDLETPDVSALAIGEYLTVDIDQVGSSVAGSDLTVIVWVTT